MVLFLKKIRSFESCTTKIIKQFWIFEFGKITVSAHETPPGVSSQIL